MAGVLGITFDSEKHTYDDFGLRIKSINIGFPSVKESKIEIPGADGYLDITDYFGTRYENRKLTIECDLEDNGYYNWAGIISQLSNYLHGKKRKIVLDWDNGFYYLGRGNCEYEKKNRVYSLITLKFDCDPYKYELTATDEDWLWDPLDFEEGSIKEYGNLVVDGTLTLTVIGSPMPVVPNIIVSSDMKVNFDGEIYELKRGENYLPDIEIKDGEYMMTFTGHGIATVSYRGGSL